MTHECFLLDSNSLITPHLNYYPFDFASGFWQQMKFHIASGRIAVLDMVKNEISKVNDDLSSWIKGLEIGVYIDHREPSIVQSYGDVLQAIQNDRRYQSSALFEWSRGSVADPWLIATANVMGYTIITFEKPNSNLNDRYPSKQAKIPDIVRRFNVTTNNLFYMMRELRFSL